MFQRIVPLLRSIALSVPHGGAMPGYPLVVEENSDHRRAVFDSVAGVAVSFGRAFAVGPLIAVVASVCYVATWEVISSTPKTSKAHVAHSGVHDGRWIES